MDEAFADWAQRTGFIGVTPAIRAELRAFWPMVQRARPGILGSFHPHALAVPRLAAMLGGRTDALKVAQGRHWERLFSGSFDDGYHASVRMIGEVHARIAAAVEQQGAATQEIARNVAEAATRSGEVSRHIAAVSTGAGEADAASATLLTAANALAGRAETLRGAVDGFVGTLRAA